MSAQKCEHRRMKRDMYVNLQGGHYSEACPDCGHTLHRHIDPHDALRDMWKFAPVPKEKPPTP